jgi:translation initiation factor 3 subunit B
LWGGPNFNKLARFRHPGVKLIDFSPCEKYLVTASPQFQENDDPKDPQCIIVWDIRTGTKLRGFLAQSQQPTWPSFKWSGNDKYLARLSEDTISVYETPSMDLLEKKSIKVPGVKDFAWSPTDNIISYFVPEANNKPASVVLLEIPSRTPRSQKNLFNVHDVRVVLYHINCNRSVKCIGIQMETS